MPRKLLEKTDVFPYHVTGRTNNREVFGLSMDTGWDIFGSECLTMNLISGIEIHAFVLMPNHFHMLITVPELDLGTVMRDFMSNVTRVHNRTAKRSGHLFGGPYHWSLIHSARYFGHAYKYVYRNPIKAGLCTRVEDYPYSTLFGQLGSAFLPFPIYFTRLGMEARLPSSEPFENLEWLNRPFSDEADRLIQKGLRKKVFEGLIHRKTRTPYEPLERLL
jgi:putative transposase